MVRNNPLSSKQNFFKEIQNLLTEYKKEDLYGICFRLDKDKSPLDVIGVLDFLKYKIKNWGNDNIFSYLGTFFGEDIILVIGARNIEDAITMILTVLISNINNVEYLFEKLYIELENSSNIEQYLRSEISVKIKNGYPVNSQLEAELKTHLNELLKE